jgi:hypothetical protein
VSNLPRVIYAEAYEVFGDENRWREHLLLVEQPDGSWRKPTGADLIALHERYPRLLGGSLPRK